ncbi:unnamed protein product [Rotaria sordida]|uniref:Uncharacterized protein n=1 Tax=Rotaria sordida TaxID=392033 RepID=A0A813P2E0_9BILA|nr:unnamed protein product [Rotaria sordida]
MFQEAFRSASPEARAQFMQNGGEQKVTEAFGTAYTDEYSGATTYSANSETARAMDYVKSGKLDTATKIGDNTGVFNDNEDAIVATINQMSAAERQSYAAGQKLATADAATLNPPDKANLEYYNKVHSALDKAGNEREMAKWEDMIATGKDGSLVTRLAAHGGMIDDGMGKVLGTIESMPKEDWERLKSDPEYRKKVEATLAIDLSDSEMARAREAIDKKMVAGTFEESKNAQRSVVEAVKDERGVFNDNEEGIIRALEKMTPDDQRKYREDPEFKKQLDAQVAKGMDYGSERDAAMRILDKVAKGEKPESDIVSKLEMHSNDFNTDEAKVIADIEASFRNDPTLRDRLRNPQTAEDKVMAEKFNTAIHKALDQDEYDKYAKPLIENGRIPFAVKAELFKGTFDDDENGVYDALKKGNGTPEDWKELLTNAEKTLPFMSADEREVAMNIARQQGVMKPEDELRAAILGAGTDEAKIKEVLATFDPAKLQAAKDSYETKYGASLTGDVLGELGGSDKANAERALRGPQTAREAYNDIRTDVSEGVDGIGESVVNALDGTAAMTKDQVEQLSADMALNSKNGTEMSLEAVKGHQDAVYGSLDLYSESEKAAAQTAALVATTILTLPVSGGASLALLAARAGGLAATGTGSALLASAVTGAVVELGVETAIRGKNFDYGSADVVTALGAGAVNGGTMLLGGAQVGAALKVGEGSAIAAAKTVVAEVDNLAVAGGRQLLKEGAEATITKEIAEQVAVTISNGSKVVDDKAVAVIAEKVAASASDVPQIEQVIKANLAKAIEAEAAKGSLAAKEIALNTGAGVVGGGLTGGVNGASEGGSVEEIAKQVVMGAAFGGFAAGGVTALTKGAGRAASAFRHGDELHVPGSALESDAGSELSRVKLDRNGRVSEVAAPEGKIKIGYHKSGDLQGEVREVAFANNVTYSSKDGATWTVKDATAPGGKC